MQDRQAGDRSRLLLQRAEERARLHEGAAEGDGAALIRSGIQDAANALEEMYGVDALARAIAMERRAGSPVFARLVRLEIERRMVRIAGQAV